MQQNMAIAKPTMITWRSFAGGYEKSVTLRSERTLSWLKIGPWQQTSCTSMLHPALAKYWKKLLVPNTIELKEAPLPRKRCLKAFSENVFTESRQASATEIGWAVIHQKCMPVVLNKTPLVHVSFAGDVFVCFCREVMEAALKVEVSKKNHPEEWVTLNGGFVRESAPKCP